MIRLNLSILGEIRCFRLGTRSVCERVNQENKRGSMLAHMITDKDKRKNWYFHILKNTPKSKNVFEKVHRPNRRQSVLNSLFIQNITDVLSTNDAAPEFVGSGIEITGVKVAPTCKDLHVYWQIPPSKFDNDEELAKLLNLKAPQIRAELISRNVMGCVPHIHFVRDTSNAYVAAFEKALREADCGPKGRPSIVPDDTFTTKKKKIYTFRTPKGDQEKKIEVADSLKTADRSIGTPPPRPLDMKSNVFGLAHDSLMNKIVALKCLPKPSCSNNVILSTQLNETTDLFSKIPGTTIEGNSDRENILKQFHIQRKILRNKNYPKPKTEDHLLATDYSSNEVEQVENVGEEDFIEEDTSERF